jgi:MHS family proline/betaine transporter-like MFS transporter
MAFIDNLGSYRSNAVREALEASGRPSAAHSSGVNPSVRRALRRGNCFRSSICIPSLLSLKRTPGASVTTTNDTTMIRRVVWASTVGNALEWFDFTVFGLFAPTIGRKFFPGNDPTTAVLSAYGLLAVAYLFRPVGGVLLGMWADRVGRKRALILIVMSMAISTFSIGIMPTYSSVGILAPVLLLVARLIQGFSAGGEFGASTAMLVEFAPEGRRGFYASFQFVAQNLAFAFGAAFAFFVSVALTPEQASDWGWRLPFLFGIVIGPVGFYLRSKIDETPAFKAFVAEQAGVPNTPLREVLTHFPRPLIALFLMIAGLTAFTYLGNVLLTNFSASELKLPAYAAQIGVLVVNLLSAVLMPFAAGLSDRFGRRAVIAPAIILLLAVYLPLGHALVTDPSVSGLWLAQACGLIFTGVSGPFAALALETFPVGVRSTGASIIYNFGVAIFGGMSPFLVTELFKITGSRFSPFLYLGVCLILSLIGIALLPSKRSKSSASNNAATQLSQGVNK